MSALMIWYREASPSFTFEEPFMNLAAAACRIAVIDQLDFCILLEILRIGRAGKYDEKGLEIVPTEEWDIEDRGSVVDDGPVDVIPDIATQVLSRGCIAIVGVLVSDSGSVADRVVVRVT
jgi:hypothetical protein